MSAAWESYLARARREHGDRLDLSEINQTFLPYFRGPRVKVEFYGEMTLTGTVGVTTGWRPVLLLMRRSDSIGSSDLLTSRARLLAVQRGRKYVEV